MSARCSVVVPAYNAAGTIAATLRSLLEQTVPAFEIIVVDDGSRDRTGEVVAEFGDRVRLISQANSGVSVTRNRGVAEARGDWVAFCDADDLWHPEKLQVVTAVLELAPPVDLVFHDFWTIIDDRLVDSRATHSPDTLFPLFREVKTSIPQILPQRGSVRTASTAFPVVDTWTGHAFRWLMLGNFLMPSTVAVRRAAFVQVGGFDPEFRHAEDTEFFLRFSKSAAFLWVDAALTGYRRAAGSLLTSNMFPTTLNGTRAVVKHCVEDAAVYRHDRQWVGRAVARRFSRLAYFCLTELRVREAREYAWTAIRYDWTNRRAWSVAFGAALPSPVLEGIRRFKALIR